MKRQHTLLAGVLATALLVPWPAGATLSVTTSSVVFSNGASVSDAEGGGTTTNNNASLGTTSISQFDPATGVLMGTTLNLTSTQTQTVTVTSTDGPNTGTANSVTTDGSGTSTAKITAPGVSNTFSAITASDTCTGSRTGACSDGATISAPAATNLAAAVAAASLDSYVGSGTVSVARTATILSSTQGSPSFTGTESTDYALTWAGSLSATYDYLLHAAPSFAGGSTLLTLNLDFGTVFLGDSASLGFSVFNLDDANRVGLDLDGFSETSDPSNKFSTNLALFSGLAEGGSSPLFTAFFDTSSLGTFSGGYTLTLSDADVGAASSRSGFTLYLNLTGTVTQRSIDPPGPASVPEPGMLALLGIGLLGLGLGRRKTR